MFRRLCCALRGHTAVLRIAPGKLCLVCPCGYASPGWRVDR